MFAAILRRLFTGPSLDSIFYYFLFVVSRPLFTTIYSFIHSLSPTPAIHSYYTRYSFHFPIPFVLVSSSLSFSFPSFFFFVHPLSLPVFSPFDLILFALAFFLLFLPAPPIHVRNARSIYDVNVEPALSFCVVFISSLKKQRGLNEGERQSVVSERGPKWEKRRGGEGDLLHARHCGQNKIRKKKKSDTAMKNKRNDQLGLSIEDEKWRLCACV